MEIFKITLGDADYVTKIHETYLRARAFYSDLEDKCLLWEMLKMEMRATTISFSKNKAKLTNRKESQIKARVEELDRLICNNFNSPDIDNVLRQYENLKMELQSIYDQKGKAAIFRSKCRWVENGECPTKYFFNLEKKNHNKKTIRELRTEDDSTTYNDEKILEAIERYYKTLYTCTTHEYDLNDFIEHLDIPKLTDEERDRIEGPISLQECKLALDTFQASILSDYWERT